MTQDELDEIREDAYQEGYLVGCEVGYERGYDDGYYDRQCDVAEFFAKHGQIPPIEYEDL